MAIIYWLIECESKAKKNSLKSKIVRLQPSLAWIIQRNEMTTPCVRSADELFIYCINFDAADKQLFIDTVEHPPNDNDNRAMCMEVWFRGMFGGVSPNCFSIRQRQIVCEWSMMMGGSRVVLLCHVKPKLINLKWRYFFNWKMQSNDLSRTSHSRLNWIRISNMRSIHLTLKSILRPHSPSSKTTRPEHWRSFTIHSMWQLAIVTMVLGALLWAAVWW